MANAAPENQPVPGLVYSLHPDDEQLPVRPIIPATMSPEHLSVDYFKDYLADTGNILALPLHTDTNGWLKAGGVLAATGGLFFADANIRDFTQKHHSPAADTLSSAGKIAGNPLYTVPAVGAFYLYGYLYDDNKARKTSLLAIESLAISSVFTGVLKNAFHRDRPESGASPYQWEGPQLNLKNLSFCSGHTSSAFSIATVFAEQYKDSSYVPDIAYGLAILAGLSRIYDNKHWASDVFFGAALGYFVGKSVVSLHNDHTTNGSAISIVPDIGPKYNGITLQYKF